MAMALTEPPVGGWLVEVSACVCGGGGGIDGELDLMMMIVRVSELTECGGDVLAVWMDVFDGEDGED